jgi:hypothetical protein
MGFSMKQLGPAIRGTFIIDKEEILRWQVVNGMERARSLPLITRMRSLLSKHFGSPVQLLVCPAAGTHFRRLQLNGRQTFEDVRGSKPHCPRKKFALTRGLCASSYAKISGNVRGFGLLWCSVEATLPLQWKIG